MPRFAPPPNPLAPALLHEYKHIMQAGQVDCITVTEILILQLS